MDINPDARVLINKFSLLAPYIIFIPQSSASPVARMIANSAFWEMKPSNVSLSLDGDHHREAAYNELIHYHQYSVNMGNYILVQDTRLSRKWHQLYCAQSAYDGPCNGPEEAVHWFLKKEGHVCFEIDLSKEYLFSTHHKGWLKRVEISLNESFPTG